MPRPRAHRPRREGSHVPPRNACLPAVRLRCEQPNAPQMLTNTVKEVTVYSEGGFLPAYGTLFVVPCLPLSRAFWQAATPGPARTMSLTPHASTLPLMLSLLNTATLSKYQVADALFSRSSPPLRLPFRMPE